MRIFDETKTNELSSYNLEKGYLINDKLFIKHHEAVEASEEQGHYETVAEYPNGGKDVEWVIDSPKIESKEAYDEYEDIQIYIPYSKKQLNTFEISKLKAKLSATDYQALKFAEGFISEEDYAEIKAQRQAWRSRINELEEVIKEDTENEEA